MNATAEEQRLHVHKGESMSAQVTGDQLPSCLFCNNFPKCERAKKKISVMFNLDELSRRLFKIRHLC